MKKVETEMRATMDVTMKLREDHTQAVRTAGAERTQLAAAIKDVDAALDRSVQR